MNTPAIFCAHRDTDLHFTAAIYLRVWQDSHCCCRALDVRVGSPHRAKLHLRYVLLKKHHRKRSLLGNTSLTPVPDLLSWSVQKVFHTNSIACLEP